MADAYDRMGNLVAGGDLVRMREDGDPRWPTWGVGIVLDSRTVTSRASESFVFVRVLWSGQALKPITEVNCWNVVVIKRREKQDE